MEADILGLALNFVGALVLALSANIQADITTKIVDSIASAYGTWSAEKIPENIIRELKSKKGISKALNWIGYLFFIGGFGIQICAQLHLFNL